MRSSPIPEYCQEIINTVVELMPEFEESDNDLRPDDVISLFFDPLDQQHLRACSLCRGILNSFIFEQNYLPLSLPDLD